VFDTDGVGATINPNGSGSENVTPVNGVVVFGFVNVNVNTVVAPTRTGDGPNAFANDGGNATITDAFAVFPVPPSVEVTAPLVLSFTPADVPRTFTCTEQLPDAGIDPPDKDTEPLAATAVTVPPQVFDNPFGVPTTSPPGRVSVNVTPDSPVAEFGFVIVNLNVVVPFSGNTDLPNTLVIDGGATTNSDADAVLPVPPFVELTAPEVLGFGPAVVPTTSTLTWHVNPGASVPFTNEMLLVPASAVTVPPHVVDDPLGDATTRPFGSTSENASPDAATVLKFAIVKVKVVVPFNGIDGAPNAFSIAGGPTTSNESVAGAPVPPWFDDGVTLLSCGPTVIPVTSTLIVHCSAGAISPPVRLTVPLPATAVMIELAPQEPV
jgi:hypothetical protein